MKTDTGEITSLLARVRMGDRAAESDLADRVYGELRRLARIRMYGERRSHTLSPTALAHEAWIRVEPDLANRGIADRQHFFAVAATAMRRILVEHARRRKAAKRGGRYPTPSAEALSDDDRLLGLDATLDRLGRIKPRAAKVVELRFFGGLTHEEIAAVLQLERRTVDRDWAMARSWLSRELASFAADGAARNAVCPRED